MTYRLPKLRDWRPGDSYRESAHLQEPVTAVRALAEAAGFGPVAGDIFPGFRFPAQITDRTQDGSRKRWIYQFEEVWKIRAGYGSGSNSGWASKTDGITGTAYNLAEDANDATGLYGNGVNSSNLIGTFDVQPIPNGRVVEILVVATEWDATEFWFSAENGIDGACS